MIFGQACFFQQFYAEFNGTMITLDRLRMNAVRRRMAGQNIHIGSGRDGSERLMPRRHAKAGALEYMSMQGGAVGIGRPFSSSGARCSIHDFKARERHRRLGGQGVFGAPLFAAQSSAAYPYPVQRSRILL